MGLLAPRPRFCFTASVTHNRQRQAAYRILVADQAADLLLEQGNLWDSGQVASSSGLNIPYDGKPLPTGAIAWWTVRIWDETGAATPYCPPRRLVMGLLDSRFDEPFMSFVPGYLPGAAYFRCPFKLALPAVKAVCFWSGLGYGELYVNGSKADDSVLDPGVTDYSRRYLYRTHVITDLLRAGANEFLAVLGNGWHGSPKFIFRCDITLADGSSLRIGSGLPWRWRYSPGPVGSNSIYQGESYDARLEQLLAEDDASLLPQHVHRSLLDTGRPAPQIMEPIRVVADIKPISVGEPKPGIQVFDLGQNFAGWAGIRVRGEAGTVVTLRYAENLRADGTIDPGTLRSARSTDQYVLKGDAGIESWEPRFTYHGFRYVQVEGLVKPIGLADLTGRVVRSAVAELGDFSCSDALLNRIFANIRWTEQNNLHSIPTDCPQRDERMGWLNDATVRLEGALFLYHLPLLYNKWLDDIADTQDASGAIADTAPFNWGNRPADPVCSSYLLLAWNLYLFYGDLTAIADHYDGFKAWQACLLVHAKDHIVQYSHWGDWCQPLSFTDGQSPRSAVTPGQLMSTGYFYLNALLLARMAMLLEKPDDEADYTAMAGQISQAFWLAFDPMLTEAPAQDSVAGLVFALYLGLVPPERIDAVTNRVLAGVAAAGGHLTTGNQCTKYLLEMLSEHGHIDTALAIARQRDYPGWGYMIEHGATTVWERWEHETGGGMNSHNHPMLGSIGAWFFKYLGGIRPDWRYPAFARVDLQPFIPKDLEQVSVRYQSLRGDLVSAWQQTTAGLRIFVQVPLGTAALLHLTARQGIRPPQAGQITINDISQPFQETIDLLAGVYDIMV
jgi:alpha-L-rhamnosidase